MEYYVYIYGRTFESDFRSICVPPIEIMDWKETESFVKQVLNTDVLANGPLNKKRYAFYHFDKSVLFGVGFSHVSKSFQEYNDLSNYTSDKFPRDLRSFVGIVIDSREFSRQNSMPIEDKFFYALFEKYVVPYWNWPEFKPWNPKISGKEHYENSSCDLVMDGNALFNSDKGCCKFFTERSEKTVLSSMKSCNANFITGLNVESHVISAANAKPRVQINNAVCSDTKDVHTVKIERDKKELKTIGNSVNSNKMDNTNIAVEKRSPSTSSEKGFIDREIDFVKRLIHRQSNKNVFEDNTVNNNQYKPSSTTDWINKKPSNTTISNKQENEWDKNLMGWDDLGANEENNIDTKDNLVTLEKQNKQDAVEQFNMFAQDDREGKQVEINALVKQLINKYGVDEAYNKIKSMIDK